MTYPVAETNSANRWLLTACASMRKAETRTSRTGPSPSSRKPSGSSEPMRNEPPGSSAIPSPDPGAADATGAVSSGSAWSEGMFPDGPSGPPRPGEQQPDGAMWFIP